MKKSSLLALAIAGTIAAPVAMAEVYLSARIGMDLNQSDNDADESLQIENLSSRMGWKGETDLGNGLSGYGKLEVATTDFAYRDLYVGLKGDWGQVQLSEKAYGAFYNHVTGPVDQPYFIGGLGFLKTGRSENMISYMGGGDKFSFQVDLEADGTDSTDVNGVNSSTSGYQAAASLGLGDNWTIAVGAANAEDSLNDSNATNATVAGATVHGTIGDFFIAGSYQQDDDDTGVQLHAAYSNFFVNFGSRDKDIENATPTQMGIGYAKSIGENTTFWAEAQASDSDDEVGEFDSTRILAALRFDIE